ncbi:HlyD family efflux transporter periplasmic adaptor subunit [Mariniblastus sp.]|nr:HlyD family efflux transporter periplasmic adaptor subunit [Mariniblastus sp.]MDC0284578.1 HlyD family efflux transporter periplasmic adaptor subunit [Mariniblastus sp.]
MNQRTGTVKLIILVALLLCSTVVVGSLLMRNYGDNKATIGADAITFTAFKGTFISSVNEVGDIGSSSNIEIRCRVKSRGKEGVAILDLVPEGTKVEEGDFLCQLDDSLLKEELTERKIVVAKDKSDVIKAKSQLEAAESKLAEFAGGRYLQQVKKLKADIFVAEEKLNRANEQYVHTKKLSLKGYALPSQVTSDKSALDIARENFSLANGELQIYENYSREREEDELNAEIKQQEAQLEASQFRLDLSQQREAEYLRQVESCRITAPQAGTVVYANDSDRRDSSIVIEKGRSIRDGQEIFYLPDPTKMQVNAKVSDSKINKVKVGQRVEIRVDTAPETPIAGIVRRVSSFPLPRRYYQAPIEYEVFVDITESSPLIRGGLRGKVEIFVEQQENALMVPVSSLVLRGKDTYFVIVKTPAGTIEPKSVSIGSNNDKFAVITKGLSAGEEILVDADTYRDAIEFPTVP